MYIITEFNHKRLIVDVLTKAGLPTEQAEITSEIMGYADQRGIDSHGMILLDLYVRRIKEGIINTAPNYKWELQNENVALLDADLGIGHFIGNLAMEIAIEKAKKNTIGLVLVKRATHYGASGYYTELAAKQGMIGFSTTNTLPLMPPTGGAERVLGNNPISFSVPRENTNPIILDIACSVVAAGKLILAEQKGEKIPETWALDKCGRPTTDPYEGYAGGGSLLPIANHKGYGLSLIMDVLSGVLTGSGYGKNVAHSNIGFIMMAINSEEIMPKEVFNLRLEDFISMIKDSKRVPGIDSIYLPGEIEYKTQQTRLASGIPINDNLYNELQSLTLELELNINNYFQN